MKTFENSLILAVDSHFGIYIPQVFIERYGEFLDLSEDEIQTLSSHENELYFETWEYVSCRPFILDGIEYCIIENEDLWILPTDVEIPEDFFI